MKTTEDKFFPAKNAYPDDGGGPDDEEKDDDLESDDSDLPAEGLETEETEETF